MEKKTMKAAYINSFGGPEVIEYGDVPIPTLKENEILVKNQCIGVGKPDHLVRSGIDPYLKNKFPNLIIGNESSGEVVAVGSGVKDYKVGDYVSVLNGTGCGSHAEYSACAENFAIKLPEGVTPLMVPGILNLQVAYAILFDAARGTDEKSLYIQGAAGGLGTTLVQMAKAKGMQVIASASTEKKCNTLKDLGVDVVFNHVGADVCTKVLEATNGRGVDLILDQYAGENLKNEFSYLADFGKIVLYNWMMGDPKLDQLKTIETQAKKSHSICAFSFHVYDNNKERRLLNAKNCFEMIKNGSVKPLVYKSLPLSEAKKAHEILDSGEVIGKLIMQP